MGIPTGNERLNEAVSIGTAMARRHILRAAAAENFDGAITDFSTGADYATIVAAHPASVLDLFEEFGESVNSLAFALWAEDFGGETVVAGTDTCGFQVIGYHEQPSDGTLLLQCNAAACISGTMETLNPTGLADDALATGTAYWMDTVAYSVNATIGGVAAIPESGQNRIAWTRFDVWGYRYLAWLINKSDGGTATETPSIGVVAHKT